jgi:hypothetical protein
LITKNVLHSRRYLLFHYLLLLVVLIIVAAVRVRLFDIPLERDEGEYAYLGQLILKGIPPYLNAYSMKLPGAGMAYAVIMSLFGQTPFGIHLGLLIVNVLSAALVWLLARRLFEKLTATVATMIYLLLSLSQGVFGVFAHATHFVVLFSLAGYVLLLHFLTNHRRFHLATSGFCLGLAFIMKQHAVPLVVFAFLYLLWNEYKKGCSAKRLLSEGGLFSGCAAAPFTAIVLWVVQAGTFGRFWFWTVAYARGYASRDIFSKGLTAPISYLASTMADIAFYQLAIWLAAGVGIALMLLRRYRSMDRLFMFGFSFSAFLAMCPGFYFRGHYFVLILAPIALLSAFAVTKSADLVPASFSPWARDTIAAGLLLSLLGFGLYQERSYFFGLSPLEVSRDTYGTNPFPESLEIARYIRQHSAPGDRIAVLGSEPQIYFYANRLSATGHIYMYGLMEDQQYAEMMQQQMISDIEAARPLYIVNVNAQASWLRNVKSPQNLGMWAYGYIGKHYRLVGIADIYQDTTNYLWDGDVFGYVPRSDSFIALWKRT